ncbi:aminoacyltransferase [Staphylococcus ratti]|uniref:Aminoacyltransferase n=1 Tax=Staphylococcus ratti TaxID=2892440 RepID=A0ABY3PAT2_9STAP|nr:aminoacyltransferase [Staphylococcus ratti]UEX89417.1 aminoacyltransferase [Staphylococcus ratti]
MKFEVLTPDEYHHFIQHQFKQYTQSLEHYESKTKNAARIDLLGVKDDQGQVIAAGLFTSAPLLKYFNYVYSHRGPILDYDNEALVQYYFNELKHYFKKRRTLFILTDPYIIRTLRDYKGTILKQNDNTNWMNRLNQLGFKHQGYTTGYSELSQARWLSILDLSEKDEQALLKQMDYNTAHSIKKAMNMGVEVRTLSIDEIDTFYALYQKAEIKHGFSLFSKPYFKSFLKNYPTISTMKLAYVNLNKHIALLKTKAHDVNEIIHGMSASHTKPLSKKKQNKLNEQLIIYNKLEKDIVEAQQLRVKYGDTLDLAAAIFAENNNELVYLFSGSDPIFNKFMGNYVLQWHMIQHAKSQNLERYNFYGITGNFSKEAKDYGVLQFKKGFGGYVEELVGDFICVTNPLIYRIYQLKNKFSFK